MVANYRGDKTKAPGYTTAAPIYPAMREVFERLGRQDTLVNLVELALRHLELNLHEADDERTFIDELCAKHEISSSLGVPWEEVRRNSALNGLAQAFAYADQFFKQLGWEYRLFKNSEGAQWKSKGVDGRQLGALERIAENLPRESREMIVDCPEYDLIEYYRTLRNKVLHPDDGRFLDLVESARLNLRKKHGDFFLDNYGYQPATIGVTGYDDFVLFTRAVKVIARVLNEACALKIEDIARVHLADADFVRGIRRLKGKKGGAQRAARKLGKIYQLKLEQLRQLEVLIGAFMDSDPPNSVRRRATRSGRA